ncbi:MAG: sodium-dependent transporter, partial [Odoribacter sp.]
KGIERYTKMMMPLLFVIIIAISIRSCTLEGAGEGLKFLFYPKFSELTNQGILSALGQAFFSLSIGMGVLLTYASYLRKDNNLTHISLQVITTDTLVALLAGIAILPAVFAFNMDPQAGPGLVFLTLPKVFQSLPAGQVWAILFFILLTFAALTSAISLLEVIVAYLVEEKRMSRIKSTIITTLGILFLGIPCTLSFGPLSHLRLFGLSLFDLFDFVSSNLLLPLGGILLCIFAGWRLDQSILHSELSNNGTIKLHFFRLYIFILKYVAPAGILLIFLNVLGIIG